MRKIDNKCCGKDADPHLWLSGIGVGDHLRLEPGQSVQGGEEGRGRPRHQRLHAVYGAHHRHQLRDASPLKGGQRPGERLRRVDGVAEELKTSRQTSLQLQRQLVRIT